MARIPETWIEAAFEELSRLEQPHKAKKRATIVALITAHLNGTPESEVWKKPNTCSQTTYYRSWKDDPLFANVLARVERIAQDFTDREHLIAVQRAAQALQLAAPDAAQTLINNLKGEAKDEIRAANSILDRAGLDQAQERAAGEGNALSLENWRETVRKRRNAVSEMLGVYDQYDEIEPGEPEIDDQEEE